MSVTSSLHTNGSNLTCEGWHVMGTAIAGIASSENAYTPFDFLITDLAHMKRAEPWRSFVYVIQHDEAGPVKIGQAASPIARLAQLQASSPVEMHLRAAIACKGMNAVERRAHKIAAEQRLRGEWFDLSVLEAVETILRAASFEKVAILPVWEDFRPMFAAYGERGEMEKRLGID